MPFPTRKAALAAAAAFGLLALAACGGGGGAPGAQTSRVTLPEGHTVASGSFTVSAGKAVERGGLRFSCAAGGTTCAVTVDPSSGTARVTGGRLTVVRIQAMPNDGGQDGDAPSETGQVEVPWPDWPIQDVAAARTRMSGETLSWSSNDILNRVKAHGDHHESPSSSSGSSGIRPGQQGWCIVGGYLIDRCLSSLEYQSVMTYRDISIVQARYGGSARSVGDESGLGGILDYGVFMVGNSFWEAPLDFGGEDHPGFGAGYFAHSDEGSFRDTWSGRWRGALVGTGNAPVGTTGIGRTSPLYRQFIMGDVDITAGPASLEGYTRFQVEFSNIRNIGTGESVTLSHMRWDLDNQPHRNAGNYGSLSPPGGASPTWSPGYIGMSVTGPNDAEVLGVFYTEEAVGGFGAKKQ